MEPFKALSLIAAAGVVSLIGAGAAGFYAGYSEGRGALGDRHAIIANNAQGGTVISMKPVLEEIRALANKVDTLGAAIKPVGDQRQDLKSVLDEIRGLGQRMDGSKGAPANLAPSAQAAAVSGPNYRPDLDAIRKEIEALAIKLDKQEQTAPKALLDEIRALSASVQAQEPASKREVSDDIRQAVATLQNAEPRAPKALLDQIQNLAAAVKAQNANTSLSEQIKRVSASLDALKTKLPDSVAEEVRRVSAQVQGLAGQVAALQSGGAKGDPALGAELAQLRQLVAGASDQFGKCQSRLASLTAASFAPEAQAAQPTAAQVTISQKTSPEPSKVVFYDNVMLRKDEEKLYNQIGVKLTLQSVAPKQVRLAVNSQGFGLAFGERKVFRSQDMECELNLMETDLNETKARVSISCKH